jgi:hypothetical protein
MSNRTFGPLMSARTPNYWPVYSVLERGFMFGDRGCTGKTPERHFGGVSYELKSLLRAKPDSGTNPRQFYHGQLSAPTGSFLVFMFPTLTWEIGSGQWSSTTL